MSYLPAEWHKQSLIQLTWPHKDTDWAYMLDEVNDCFLKIAYEVLKRQSLLIVAPDPDSIRNSIDNYGADIQKLITSKINTNDTWARDHAFIVEPVSVHGHLQHEPQCQLLRERHRPRHGVPGFLSGSAGLRPHDPFPRTGAHPGHCCHPV